MTATNANAYYDMPVIFERQKLVYYNAPQAGRGYVADLGFITPQGQFILLTPQQYDYASAGQSVRRH